MCRNVLLAATLIGVCLNLNAVSAADWPQWRGPHRTGVSEEKGLLRHWPKGGPARLWLFDDAGIGYAGPAIAQGRLYIMGGRDGTEYLLALDAQRGNELWSAEIGSILENNWGDGPRGTPTVDGDRVYAMGGRGDLICAHVRDGGVIWRSRMQDWGGSIPNWGYCESVLVDGNQVVCTPGGGNGAIVALDKSTGKLIWQSEEFTDGAQYASVVATVHNGVRQYVQLTQEHVVGVSAQDGALLWQAPWIGQTAVVATPIIHRGHVYVTSGYGAGCKLVALGRNHNVTEIYANKHMKNHHGGVLLANGHVYGYSDGGGWLCQDFMTGEVLWRERSKFGKGAITCADGMLYCFDESNGTVALIQASPQGWQEHGRFTLEPLSEQRNPSGGIWTHPVVANGKLFLRDQELLFCYDVKRRDE